VAAEHASRAQKKLDKPRTKYSMSNTVFVKAVFDLDCEWEGLPPSYRVYVNDELFAERTWRWNDSYLEEMLQIQAPPGLYEITLQPVPPTLARFQITNRRVEHGPGRWISDTVLEIAQ
jgi:hypothetical protein